MTSWRTRSRSFWETSPFLDFPQRNLETTLDTLIAGGVRQIAFFNLPDLSVVPAVLSGVMVLPEPQRSQALINFQVASSDWSRRLHGIASSRNILLIDVFSLAQAMVASPENFTLLGQQGTPPLCFGTLDTCPLCAFADPIHPSSAAVGFITNLTIAEMNRFFGTSIPVLTQSELESLTQDDDQDVLNNTA